MSATNRIFNRAAVLDSLEGNADLLHEIVGIFLMRYPNQMAKIREAIATRDAKTLERAAHALKGSAAHLLAAGVAEAASQLEIMGRAGTFDDASESLQALEEQLAKLHRALAEFEKEHARP